MLRRWVRHAEINSGQMRAHEARSGGGGENTVRCEVKAILGKTRSTPAGRSRGGPGRRASASRRPRELAPRPLDAEWWYPLSMRTLSDVELRPADRAAIVAAAGMLRERFPVLRVCLFGSKATGRDDAESDIDLFVLTSRSLSWRERDAVTDALFDIEMEFGVVISTLIASEDDWLRGPYQVLAIRGEVERDAVAA